MLRKTVMFSMLFCLIAATGVYAQGKNSPPSEGAPVTKEGNVSFDFRDADIRNIFRILSFKSGVNIVAGPEVTGVVTMKLDDVPWQQALDVILDTYGYAYEKKGSIISVTTIEILRQRRENTVLLAEQEALETKIFTLNFGKASEIIESIGKMTSERGAINFDERTNSIIVTDIQSRLDLISDVVETLDTTTPQVLIEAKIIETNLNDAENLGIDWTTKASLQGAARDITFPFKRGATDNRFAGTVDAATASTVGTLSFSEFKVVLELLKNRTNTNILSNPKIVTLDNQEAIINIGEERRFVTSVTSNTQTGQTQSSTEKRKVGINFSVTPHVNPAGFVTLDVEPEVSEDTGRSDIVDTNPIPIIGIKSVKTSVMVKDGDTLVIAGLIKDKLTDTKKKVPLFGDIPLVGIIFQKTEKTIVKSDLILFITPHIITPEIDQGA